MKKYNLSYLASAYTHKSKKVMEWRYKEVSRLGGLLFKKGIHNIAIIGESHSVSKYSKGLESTLWKDWRNRDGNILLRCDQLLICDFEGWDKSVGVKNEILLAHIIRIPIKMINRNGKIYSFNKKKFKLSTYKKEEKNWALKFIESNFMEII